jgi:hypothetical protein
MNGLHSKSILISVSSDESSLFIDFVISIFDSDFSSVHPSLKIIYNKKNKN